VDQVNKRTRKEERMQVMLNLIECIDNGKVLDHHTCLPSTNIIYYAGISGQRQISGKAGACVAYS